jgi:hypothetical protein
MEALLGLLLLAGILAALLGAPAWIAVSIWVLFLAVLGPGVVEYIRQSVPVFRRVRFADAETNKCFRLILPEFRGRRRRYTPTRRPGTFRAWVAERGLQLTIIALLPAALAVAVAGLKIDHKWLSVAMFLGGLVLALALLLRLQTTSQRARRHRRRVRAPDAADVLCEDRRPPVLLLRAFRADELEADAAKPSDLPITFEEFIVQPLERYGPVVAIGRPGDPLPPLGAYREYVAEWGILLTDKLLYNRKTIKLKS